MRVPSVYSVFFIKAPHPPGTVPAVQFWRNPSRDNSHKVPRAPLDLGSHFFLRRPHAPQLIQAELKTTSTSIPTSNLHNLMRQHRFPCKINNNYRKKQQQHKSTTKISARRLFSNSSDQWRMRYRTTTTTAAAAARRRVDTTFTRQ